MNLVYFSPINESRVSFAYTSEPPIKNHDLPIFYLTETLNCYFKRYVILQLVSWFCVRHSAFLLPVRTITNV